jgi:predicted RNA binding protein YcfA (HicA-like mRNA interferase family)
MKLPRDLAGRALAKVLCRDWGYRVVHQEGSHIILETHVPSHQRISIPDHNPIRIGTLNAGGSYSLGQVAPKYSSAVIRFIRAHQIPNVVLIAR